MKGPGIRKFWSQGKAWKLEKSRREQKGIMETQVKK